MLEVRPELANYTYFGNSYNVMHHAAGASSAACKLWCCSLGSRDCYLTAASLNDMLCDIPSCTLSCGPPMQLLATCKCSRQWWRRCKAAQQMWWDARPLRTSRSPASIC